MDHDHSYGKLPFGEVDSRTARDKIASGALLERGFGLSHSCPCEVLLVVDCEDVFWDTCVKAWSFNPTERPRFADIIPPFEAAMTDFVKTHGAPRDIGAEMNKLLSENVKRMSRRKSVARKASVCVDMPLFFLLTSRLFVISLRH